VSRVNSFERDDENDTRLFEKLEEYVLEHYPNPQRIGCLDHDTLCAFQETPEKLDLADLKYLHIFKCAECTRDLIELRRIREDRVLDASTSSATHPDDSRNIIRRWKGRFAAAAAFVRALAFRFAAKRRAHSSGLDDNSHAEDAVPATIDLSAEARIESRTTSHEQPATLPRNLVDLHLVLPHGSPAGIYRVTVAWETNMSPVHVDESVLAIIKGSRTELDVKLDLRYVSPGAYFLGVVCDEDRASYFYPLLLD
jgi:hypothetical protein